MKFNKISAAVAMGTLAVISMQAQGADAGSASVNAIAGLAPVVIVSCTDVNFGVWRIPNRTSGGATTVSLTVNGNTAAAATTATAAGNTTRVSLASGFVAPTAATCSVSGIMNQLATVQTSIASNTGLGFTSSNHEGLDTPISLASLSANLALGGTGVYIDTNGEGTFRVTGVLTIPTVINANHYGGYKTTGINAARVTVTDQI